MTNFPYSIGGDDVDAMIGLDYMIYFDVYFDYPDGKLLVKPNVYFFKKFHKN